MNIKVRSCNFVNASDLFTNNQWTAFVDSNVEFTFGDADMTLINIRDILRYAENWLDEESCDGYRKLLEKIAAVSNQHPGIYVDVEN